MDTPKIYLETTMFSFFYEKRTAPPYLELKTDVHRIFDLIKAGEYIPHTSIYAIDEIMNESNTRKRELMVALVNEYDVEILPASSEAQWLADLYIQEGAISPLYKTDAIHIALATLSGLDFLISLNFTHITRIWTIEKVRRVNARMKFQGIGIYKPGEVLEIYENSAGLLE